MSLLAGNHMTRTRNRNEVVVIGGGHNGLVAACYLAKAGKKVTVVEASPTFGGMTSTNPVIPAAPQHMINEGGMDVSLLKETHIVEDLELEKFGFSMIPVDPIYAYLRPEGESIVFWQSPEKTANEIKKFSKKDAAAYIEMANDLELMMAMAVPYMRNHPIRINVLDMLRGFTKLLRHPKRSLGLTRFISASHSEYIEENFEHDMVRGPLAAVVPFLPIKEEATAWMLIQFGFMHQKGVSRIRTGSGGLTNALAKCLEAHGGSIKTNARVSEILIADGRAAGVTLSSEETIHAAGGVVAACNIKNTIFDLLPEGTLSDKEINQGKHIPVSAKMSSFKIDIALKERVDMSKHQAWRDDDVDLRKTGMCWASYEDHIKAWDACARDELPEVLPTFNLIPSANDPSQAPEGMDTIWCWSGVAPTKPKGGWELNKPIAEANTMRDMVKYFANAESAEIGRRVMSVDDLSERFNVPGGNVYHVDTGVSRFGPFRPSPAFADFTTSVPGLVLSGGSMHPAAGIAGIPGMIAAKTMLRKFK
ncbi:NAD(P)/FAD-dependent oxidoreductase [Zhongshania marina]|uniref:Pyridine nucleotide-disulfide oxidoreductase domain-containing protein 2 n=2 Tax=Zhongshania marina TaxID=2304603 RepID=A0ABX9W6H4_9GAMM|nr:NAD(P)/FAD-dependent oxidoreductase [Zhongshania marina]